MLYEVRFKRFDGTVYAIEAHEAADDAIAIETARRMFHSGIGNGYEIWSGDRLVHVEAAEGSSEAADLQKNR